MEQPLPDFPLYPDPYTEGSVERRDEACLACSAVRGWTYAWPGCGDYVGSVLHFCPWCIASGSAARQFGATFNDATQYPDFEGTPQLSPSDRELIEQRTPGFTTWQGNRWLGCCGRACIYLGEAKEGDLRGRFAGAVPSIIAENEGWSDADNRELIDVIGNGFAAAYIFKCQVCGKLLGYWDCD